MGHTIRQLVSLLVVLGMLAQTLVAPFVGVGLATGRADSVSPQRGTAAAPEAEQLAAQNTAQAPEAMTGALSVSRVLSTYEVGDTLTITYTVSNNRPPTVLPHIAAGATFTETVAATADFVATDDVNTVRNVLLTTTLADGVDIEGAAPLANRQGATLAWALGDIAPMDSKQVVVRVQAVAAAGDFVALDEGARAFGLLRGRQVAAQTMAAQTASEALAQWLVWTVDADIYDEEMLNRLAGLDSAQAIFAFVQGLGFEAYEGSLRGTRGTLWSEAGNSVDQASLLVAMLRAAGIPARYRHGTLTTAQAQELLASMFVQPVRFAGQTPGAEAASDPLNDAALLAEARDHWWVEAYVPGEGWRDMDPSFAGAAIGDAYATPAGDGTDRIAELPDGVRHKIDFRLRVEDYHPLNVGGGGLNESYPFEATLNVVEAAAQPVALAHVVHSDNQGGLVFVNAVHTYTPYLLVGEREVMGEAYQEHFTNFPLGTRMLTGAWLEMTLVGPDGERQTFERALKDRIGYENRFGGGSSQIALGSDTALFTDFDMLVMGFWPNFVPEEARMRAQAAAMATAQTFSEDGAQLLALRERETLTAEEQDALRAIRTRHQVNTARFLGDMALAFADAADRMTHDLSATSFVKAYYDAPRLIVAGSEVTEEGEGLFTLDLRRTLLRTIAYPGQDTTAEVGFNIARGVVESGIEGAVLEAALGVQPVTTARLFEEAKAQGIFPAMIEAHNLNTLQALAISEEAKARISAAALAGKIIYVPHGAVLIDGEAQTGWWEIDPQTGETIGVMENGLHLAALEYVINIGMAIISGPLVDFMLGFTAYTWGFVANHVDKAIGEDTFDQDSYDWWIGVWGTTLTCIGMIASPSVYARASCVGGWAGAASGYTLDFFGAGQKAAEAYLNSVVQHDPPLPDHWVGPLPAAPEATSEVSRSVAGAEVYAAGPLAVDVATGHWLLDGEVAADWAWQGATGALPFAQLQAQGTLYDETGAQLATGMALAVEPARAAYVNGVAEADVSGAGRVAGYAAANQGLGASAWWQAYEGQLEGELLALQGAEVTVNGLFYDGALRLAPQGAAAVEGSGAGGGPVFVQSVTPTLDDGVVVVGPLSGVVTANGAAVNANNGVAVLGYTGAMTVLEEGASTDRVTLAGAADFFTLNLSATAGSGQPPAAYSFTATVEDNFGGDYVLTAAAPPGWHVTMGAGGAVSVTPPVGAAEGDYTILVTAEVDGGMNPPAAVSALYTATVEATDGLALSVAADPVYTVPMGAAPGGAAPQSERPRGDTNTGQTQVPGAAYTVLVTNTANAPRTVTLSSSGLPAGWTLLSTGPGSSAVLELAAGETGQVGLSVNAGETLPAPGTSYPFVVTATSDTGQTATETATFTMPAVPFSMLAATPVTLYARPNSTVTVGLAVTNVGNAPGNFPLAARVVSDVLQPAAAVQDGGTLAAGESFSQTVTLAVGDGLFGQTYPIYFDSPAPNSVYTQTEAVFVTLGSDTTSALFEIANDACLDGYTGLQTTLETLAAAVQALEQACGAGSCPDALREDVVASLQDVALQASLVSPLLTADEMLATAADELEAASDDAEVEQALAGIGPALAALSDEVCALDAHGLRMSWSPHFGAALRGETTPYTLHVQNQGEETTTYAITLTLPSGQQTLMETVAAGATASVPVDVMESGLGLYTLRAEATAVGPDVALAGLGAEAVARHNVVDRFVQLLAVMPDPAFVETGVSQSTVSVRVANVANVPQDVTARMEILQPDGSVRLDYDTPLALPAGAPRVHELATVDTTGWEAGVYTVTVSLVDEAYTPVFDGQGQATLTVGQGMWATHAVVPEVVAPGNVTVTTGITVGLTADGGRLTAGQLVTADQLETEDVARGIYGMPVWDDGRLTADDGRQEMVEGLGSEGELAAAGGESRLMVVEAEEAEGEIEEPEVDGWLSAPAAPEPGDEAFAPLDAGDELLTPMTHIEIGDGFVRTEEDEAEITYVGSWSDVSLARASSGAYRRSATAGDSATMTFEGTWVELGFIGDRFGGEAEVFLNGESQGVVDLYRRDDMAVGLRYEGLISATHTISVSVMGTANPFSTNRRVQLDYVDSGNDSPLPGGTLEQDSAGVILSDGWGSVNEAAASGGSYVRSGSSTAWIPFDGDSFTLQTIAYNNGGKARLYVDGVYVDTVDVYNSSVTTRAFSYEGFGPGPHTLQISSYRGVATLDAFTTPGVGPFVETDPPVVGVTRYEEDYPGIRYNGAPFTQTAQSWSRANITHVSDGQMVWSSTADDTISFDFEGSWLGIGFMTERFGGEVQIAVDGVVRDTVDLYTRESNTLSVYYDDLGEGAHTVTLTALGTRHPHALSSRLHFDFFDVWDGQPLAEGVFQETDERLILSNGWGQTTEALASGGAYGRSGNATAWFPFTGDSVTLETWAHGGLQTWMDIRIDGVPQGNFPNYNREGTARPFSFEGLGAGAHVLEIRTYRGTATIDALVTPATGANFEMPAPQGVIRYEEDHPAMRYDGHPPQQMSSSWSMGSTLNTVSGGFRASTGTAGSTLSLDFEGPWVHVGFENLGGQVEIFIDGASQGLFEPTGGAGGVNSFAFGDLGAGAHTISMTLQSGGMRPDYIDVWDGQAIDDGWYNATLSDFSGHFHFSNYNWWWQGEHEFSYEGDFVAQSLINANPNMWFTFVGNDLTLLGLNRNNTFLDVSIDGVDVGSYDMSPQFSDQPAALHFGDLGEGPHAVTISTRGGGRVDAFEVNPEGFYPYMPQIMWYDDAATEELHPDYGTGFLSSIALGDLDGDGVVELVAPARNGRLYVYRGDGLDAGDGTPVQWSSDLVGPAAEPALADLTMSGTADIVVTGHNGTFAFAHDGTLLWEQPAVASSYGDSGGLYGWNGPAIGNLDDDPEAEIVVAAWNDALYVLDHAGNIVDSTPTGTRVTSPVLADITGDGRLDIVVAQGHTLTVYAFDEVDGLTEVWAYTLQETTTRSGTYGSPGVADLDGDGLPEIVINWGPRIEALHADGTVMWSTYTGSDNHYYPSPVTVADVTGDGEINLVTASAVYGGFWVNGHNLMVLNAEGELQWEQVLDDGTSSASGVAAQDLDGDGVWEILWNGAGDGFLIIRGSDGKWLFNEPFTASGTIIDYPALGDVDGDGVADVVTAGREGLFVFSHVGHWIDSRPIWNQHTYHVTNINDNWSVPFSEPDSWEVHNTYRTQTPERNPAPSYRVEVTHTVGADGVSVLADTVSPAPRTVTGNDYGWVLQLDAYGSEQQLALDSVLPDMAPGETRLVSEGTEVAYQLPSGWNQISLPPLYVTAANIVALAPAVQTAGAGGTVTYTVTLTNATTTDDVYTLDVAGLPEGWAVEMAPVAVAAQSSVELPLVVAPLAADVAHGAAQASWPVVVGVETGAGVADQAGARLDVTTLLEASLNPTTVHAGVGQAVTYTLTITNHDAVARTYALAEGAPWPSGLAPLSIPGVVTVGAGESVDVSVGAVAQRAGAHMLAVTVGAPGVGEATATAVLRATGAGSVALALAPEPGVTGPGTAAEMTLTVSNLGLTADDYALSLALPAGWTHSLQANGEAMAEVSVPPQPFNEATLDLLVRPDVGATPGTYVITATAVSLTQPDVMDVTTGTVEVRERGVQVSVAPQEVTLPVTGAGSWQVTITNTGQVADSYWLTATGIVALDGSFSVDAVALQPGQATTVALEAGGFAFALPQRYPFSVMATSESDADVRAEDVGWVTFEAQDDVEVRWLPGSQTVTDTLKVLYMLEVRNVGNAPMTYALALDGDELLLSAPVASLTLPAKATAQVPVVVRATGPGVYTLEGAASGPGSADADTATLTVAWTNEAPVVNAGADETVNEGDLLAFDGSAVDAEGDALTIMWDFGDGETEMGTLAPQHAYGDDGVYVVTLTVGDGQLWVSDTLLVTVNNVAPDVEAGPDVTMAVGEMVQFDGSFSDPGILDTHVYAWDFGDGFGASGTLTPMREYGQAGVYVVTLTVTDDDGGVGQDTLTVTVVDDDAPPVPEGLYVPVFFGG